jgi:hypothetical protein
MVNTGLLLYAISGKGRYGQDARAKYGAASSRAVNHRIIHESARRADSCQSKEIPFLRPNIRAAIVLNEITLKS